MREMTTSEQLHGFVDDLERGIAHIPDIHLECRDVLLGGMGGSAISNDIVADCCYERSRVPIRVTKSPDLPSWVSPETLVVLSSYSGNTMETVEMYRQAMERGCNVIVITSGGIMERKAESDGVLMMPLPKGMHPRHAIGYMIGYLSGILMSVGCPGLSESIRYVLPSLRGFRDVLESQGLADTYCDMLFDRLPVFLSGRNLRSVAFRWKTQFNENSKYVAFNGCSPLFCNEDIDAWLGDVGNGVPVVLVGGGDDTNGPELSGMLDELEGSGIDHVRVDLGGTTLMDDLFRAVMLGDMISLKMAERRGIDSAAVKPVRQLKDKLLKMPGNVDGAA